MGLAASQARLLTLTSRAIDLEMRCMTLSAATLRNAQESCDLSQEYNDNLDSLSAASKDPNSEYYVGTKPTSYTINGNTAAVGSNQNLGGLGSTSPFNVDYVLKNMDCHIEHSKYIDKENGVSTKSTRSTSEIEAEMKSTYDKNQELKTKDLPASDKKLEDLNKKSQEWETKKAAYEATKNQKAENGQTKRAAYQAQKDTYVQNKATAEADITKADTDISTETGIITSKTQEITGYNTEISTQRNRYNTANSNYTSAQTEVYKYQNDLNRSGISDSEKAELNSKKAAAEAKRDAAKAEMEDADRLGSQAYNNKTAAEGEKSAAEGRKATAEANKRDAEARKEKATAQIEGADKALEELDANDQVIASKEAANKAEFGSKNPYTKQIEEEKANNDSIKSKISEYDTKINDLKNEREQVINPYNEKEQNLLDKVKKDATGLEFLNALKKGQISIVGPDGKVINYEDLKKDYNKENGLAEDDMDSTHPNMSVTYGKDDTEYKEAKEKLERDYEQAEKELSLKDKKIQMEQKQVETELNAVNTEKDSVKSLIDKNIEKGFKYGYNA